MSLNPGTRLGVYEVAGKIGEGGMGEVYQARDTTLDRDVALKVLPEAFTADPDRLARFQREAKVLASLNHPNIGAIHGLEAAPDGQALVLELIEGPTLADRIAEGPVPVEEALNIAKQIADALEAAHDQGIVHRDLKPANVKVRSDGTVKVLDFGLAKAVSSDTRGESTTTSATMSLTASATQMGMVIGTAAYMPPEQAKGKPVDKRADIWAFGAVLFELLTGRKAFPGDDVSDTLAMVLKFEPEWELLPADVTASVRRLMQRCLVKDPKLRLREVGTAIVEIHEGEIEATGAVSGSEPTPILQLWQRPAPAVVGVLLVAMVASLAAWSLTRAEVVPPDIVRFVIDPPDAAPLNFSGRAPDLVISRDGNQIVYAGGTTERNLNLLAISQINGSPLRGSEGGVAPFLSPDGEWVGFRDRASGAVLQKVSMFGGPPVLLCESPNRIFGASWGADDQIIFGTTGAGLFRVSGGGGEAEVLTTLEADEGGHYWPFIIPGQRAVLFVTAAGAPLSTGQLAVLELETGEITRLGLAGVSPHYVSTGHLVYAAEDGSVRAVPFDAASLEVTGNPVPLLEGVSVKNTGAANFTISDNGRLVYTVGGGGGVGGENSLVWVDREGQEEALSLPLQNYYWPRVSPDGTRVAVSIFGTENQDVWVSELARGTLTNLTTDAAPDNVPIWTPNGEQIVFASRRNDSRLGFFRRLADGTGPVEELLVSEASTGYFRPWDWSRDGETLVFGYQTDGTNDNIGILVLGGEGRMEPLLETGAREGAPMISPNGEWIAYMSDQTGRFEVYVERFPDLGQRRQISTIGGTGPTWSPDGRELFYRRTNDGAMMVVPIEMDPVFAPGTAQVVFEGPYMPPRANVISRNFDVAPDGDRFLLIKQGAVREGPEESVPKMTVVLNWFEELKDRVPVP